ncbi:MarR family winged helix-turn-helix transcriptional regulator [Paracoccus pacificus]|uniref:MarR family winged helix-turn-helix transcriptional regulator n=1 Tax=Paracoccus pacificus TaxID=1463598 RepID=A0ABW4R608_9RHOB
MEDSVFFKSLLRAMRELRRHYDQSATELGLTMSRARVITTLSQKEGVTQAELAAALEIEAPTLKRQIDALEAAGFIERRGMDDDARKRALFLTEKSRASRIGKFMLDTRVQVLDGISEEDQSRLAAVLDRIAENAARLNKP